MQKAFQLFIFVNLVFWQMSCAQTETNTSWIKTVISEPTIIVITFDSLEIDNAKIENGQENFYTAMDDLMWYNAELIEKMENEKITLLYFEQDSLLIETPVKNFQIVKDSTFSVYTYFKFDGSQLQRTELLELLGY
jgi:uncharacterized protein YbcC (UPF0753/DUF2309 family)